MKPLKHKTIVRFTPVDGRPSYRITCKGCDFQETARDKAGAESRAAAHIRRVRSNR